jgi:hypothetical protein
MHGSESRYVVSVEPRIPDFGSERLFVATEIEFAKARVAELEEKHKGLLSALLPVVTGEHKAEDWKHYMHELEHYADKLDKYEAGIADGLVPVKFFVANEGEDMDKAIKVRLRMEHGSIHPAKEPPRRPVRLDDGPVHVPEWQPSPATTRDVVSGFSRRGVKVGRDSIEAEFSELGGGDSADVVHQVVFVDVNDETRVTYEIYSQELPDGQRGEVDLD